MNEFYETSQIKAREIEQKKREETDYLEIVKINKDGLVSARELHEFLGVGRDFTTWIKGRIIKYDFNENIDFTVINLAHQNGGTSWGGG